MTSPLRVVPVEGSDELDAFFREGFVTYSEATIHARSGYEDWAFEALPDDDDGSTTAGSVSVASPPAPAKPPRAGAIDGNIFWGSLNIKRLMVAPEWRRHGVGRRLMAAAEAFALSRSCVLACVETFEFQAPDFYPRLGYRLDMVRTGYAGGRTFFYFSKRLGVGDPASSGGPPPSLPLLLPSSSAPAPVPAAPCGGSVVLEGGCLCGAVRYRAEGAPSSPTFCCCTLCRRAHGSCGVAWVTMPRRPPPAEGDAGAGAGAGFRWTNGTPALYRSSERGARSFCGRCGTQLMFEYAREGEEGLGETVDIATSTIDGLTPSLTSPSASSAAAGPFLPPGVAPASHTFWNDAPEWHRDSVAVGNLPVFPGRAPG